jgi:hypothetical protein
LPKFVPLVHKLVRIHSKNKDGSLKMSLNGGRNQDQSSIQDLHSDLGRTEKRKVGDPFTAIEEVGGDLF